MLKFASSKIQMNPFKVTTDRLIPLRSTQICQTSTLGCFPNGVKSVRQLSSAQCTGCAMTVWIRERARKCQKKFEGTFPVSELFLFANLDLLVSYPRPWNYFAAMLCKSGIESGRESTMSEPHTSSNMSTKLQVRWITFTSHCHFVQVRWLMFEACVSHLYSSDSFDSLDSWKSQQIGSLDWADWVRKTWYGAIWSNLKLCSKVHHVSVDWDCVAKMPWRLNCPIFPNYFPFHSWEDSVVMQCFACSRTCGTKFHHERFSGTHLRRASKRHSAWCAEMILLYESSWITGPRGISSAQQLSETIIILVYIQNFL